MSIDNALASVAVANLQRAAAWYEQTLSTLEAHDLALSKLARNSPIDREDVARLARAVPLDPARLRERYETELRPIIIGDLARHDQTLATGTGKVQIAVGVNKLAKPGDVEVQRAAWRTALDKLAAMVEP